MSAGIDRPHFAPDEFSLGAFLSRWNGRIRHDLSASEAATLPLSSLLAMADTTDRDRWRTLGLGYADPHGASWLREAIAHRHELLCADDILCCAGAQEAVASVLRAVLTPGDHAIVVLPIYEPSIRLAASIGAVTGVTLDEDPAWSLDIDRIAAAIGPRTRLVLMNFPNSPTGATLDPATLLALVALCRKHGIWLVNDEVYRLMAADRAYSPPAIATIYERGISIDALSKSFGLPGLRVGWIACQDRGLLASALLAKSGLSSCLAGPSQLLAHIALRAQDRILARNRSIALSNLGHLRGLLETHRDLFDDERPGNLGFVFPRYLGATGADRFAANLAAEAGVLVLPGSLWDSPLGTAPAGRLRIGLGSLGAGPAFAALERDLVRRRTLSEPA